MAPSLGRRTFGEWAEKTRLEARASTSETTLASVMAWILKDLILPTFEQVPIAARPPGPRQGGSRRLSQAGYAATTVKNA